MDAATAALSTALLENTIVVFMLILTRLGGLIIVAPGFGASSAPIRIRALLSIAIAAVITPLHIPSLSLEVHNLIHLAALLAREASIGLIMGSVVLIMFSSLQVTGQVVGQMSGMQMAGAYDAATDNTVSVFAKLLDLVSMAVFLLIGGHRALMSALLDTFKHLPPGLSKHAPGGAQLLQQTLSQSFEVGLRAAAPIMMSVLLAVIVTGLISRTLPQLNILAIGFGINILVLLGSLLFSIGAITWLFQAQISIAIERAVDFFAESANGLSP
jgi:flagellar biosynthetic protein FliR